MWANQAFELDSELGFSSVLVSEIHKYRHRRRLLWCYSGVFVAAAIIVILAFRLHLLVKWNE